VRHVAFLVFDDFQLLDLAGPIEVLRAATDLGADPPYRSIIVTPDGQPVRSASRVGITPDTALDQLRRNVETGDALDTVVVVGGFGARQIARQQPVLHDLRALSARARRTSSVCTGALVLAAAGLLDGYRATTHWASCDRLAEQHPAIEVQPDQIYVRDRDRWTSAGVTAGIDLFLALVEADHGRELAHSVAGWLVVFVRRPGGQAQFSVQLATQPARTPQIDEVQRWLPDHLTEDLTVEALARRASMSPRTFARAFRSETGTTPAAYIEQLRIEAARRLLEASDLTVEAIASLVGFRRAETLYRAFTRRMGTSPDRYRQHFGRPQDPRRHRGTGARDDRAGVAINPANTGA
jgi:transcriptional regulator GlxA family with amidase domain